MRGGPLSDGDVIAALQTFIVAFWAQKDRAPAPTEVNRLFERSRHRGRSNVACFVLGPDGEVLHSFNGFPGGAANPARGSIKDMARYYVAEIAKAKVGGPARTNPLALPDLKNGVRIFVRLPETRMFESYRAPVVQTVADQGEWTILARPAAPTEIDAAKLARWLRLCYPPGFNEQLHPYEKVEGKLQLRPAGDSAILSGTVRLTADRGSLRGTFQAVVAYAEGGPDLKGVLEGTYIRQSQMGREEYRVVAAVESRN